MKRFQNQRATMTSLWLSLMLLGCGGGEELVPPLDTDLSTTRSGESTIPGEPSAEEPPPAGTSDAPPASSDTATAGGEAASSEPPSPPVDAERPAGSGPDPAPTVETPATGPRGE